MCTIFVNRHIQQLSDTEIFTTRHMLIYGKRSSVDSVLSRLVKSGRIYRLARGVFVRSLSGNPTLAQIVQAKVEAFGGTVVVHAVNILSKVFLASERSHTFAKDGSSSSFETIHGVAILKNQCARKMKLYQSEAGMAARALWHLDEDWVERAVDIATASFRRTDRESYLLASSLMPAWLVKSSEHRFPERNICLRNPFLRSSKWREAMRSA